jgi:hypothetical protein
MQCPKCGFEQEEALECLHCGVVFPRIHTGFGIPAPEPAAEIPYSLSRHLTAVLLRFYRVFRWVTLACLIVVIALILHNSPAPALDTSPEATESAENKVQQFQASISQGIQDTLEIDQSELNGWLDANLGIRKPEGPKAPVLQNQDVALLARNALDAHDLTDSDVARLQSSVKDVRITLLDDSLRLYLIFESHRMDLSLQLEGQPLVQEGYLRLDPVGGRIGSLPLPPGLLRKITENLFDTPQNREKFRLPPYIRDMRIENGRLVIISG